jgi:lipopolysaccharide transport system permease protein
VSPPSPAGDPPRAAAAGAVEETVFRPEVGLARHRALLGAMRRDAARALPAARRLLAQRLRAEYRQTLLGGLLAFLPALGLVAWAVLADRARVIAVGGLRIPFPAWVLAGAVLWQTFAEALQVQIDLLVAERPLLVKLELPPEAPILAGVFRVGVHLVPRLLLLAVVFAVFRVTPGAGILLVPLALAGLIALGTALGLVLSPLHLLYRDIGKALPPVLGLWLLLTPVFYPVPASGALATLLRINPLTPLVEAGRDLLTGGVPADPCPALLVLAASLLALPAAWFFHRLALPIVLERGA